MTETGRKSLPRERVARVVKVQPAQQGGHHVDFLIGDIEYRTHWKADPPVAGDTFLASGDDPPRLGRRVGEATSGGWDRSGDGMRWRQPDASGRTRMARLRERHVIRRAVRDYLDGEGFIEIDTPLLVHAASPDVAIDSFAVGDRYLISSSEYQIKRMEVGGFDRVYTLTQNFRRGDVEGSTRSPEFTMLEWARVGESLAAIETDVEQLTWHAHRALGGDGSTVFGNYRVKLAPPWDRLTVAETVEQTAGVALPDFSLSAVTRAVEACGIDIQEIWRHDLPFLFSLLMATLQPSLGGERPVFVRDWPAFETSSAHEKAGDSIAERSELFIAGVELSDGFASLTGHDQQVAGFARQLKRRRAAGMPEVELDHAYLAALQAGLPEGAGMALGFDRLVMVLTGCTDIRQVLAFGWAEA